MSLLEPKDEKPEESWLLWGCLIVASIATHYYFGWVGIAIISGLVILAGLIMRMFRK